MPSNQSAYYMIEADLQGYCEKLRGFHSSGFWIHETVVANFLGIPKGRGVHGQVDAITSLIACIKQGYGGNSKKKTIVSTGFGQGIDISIQNNELGSIRWISQFC